MTKKERIAALRQEVDALKAEIALFKAPSPPPFVLKPDYTPEDWIAMHFALGDNRMILRGPQTLLSGLGEE